MGTQPNVFGYDTSKSVKIDLSYSFLLPFSSSKLRKPSLERLRPPKALNSVTNRCMKSKSPKMISKQNTHVSGVKTHLNSYSFPSSASRIPGKLPSEQRQNCTNKKPNLDEKPVWVRPTFHSSAGGDPMVSGSVRQESWKNQCTTKTLSKYG